MESTANNRIWRKGPPPHVGWWNATNDARARGHMYHDYWRFWDGESWSQRHLPHHKPKPVPKAFDAQRVVWNDYWPEAARVPRIDPAVGSVFWGNRWWVLRDGAPVQGTFQLPVAPLKINDPWTRWASQRNTFAGGPANLQNLPKPIGRTRMVDGNELTKLAGQAGVIAHEAKVLADRLNELIRTAS